MKSWLNFNERRVKEIGSKFNRREWSDRRGINRCPPIVLCTIFVIALTFVRIQFILAHRSCWNKLVQISFYLISSVQQQGKLLLLLFHRE